MNDQRAAIPDIAAVASLMGDKARASMLHALMGGEALTAGELARRARVTPQTASSHLGKLVDGGLLNVNESGKQRHYAIANNNVADALEVLSVIAPPLKNKSLKSAFEADAIKHARTCYDHMAGKLGVGVTRALIDQKVIVLREKEFEITKKGAMWFAEMGIDLDAERQKRRKFAYACIDWSERKPHLAGALGAALCDAFLKRNWIRRSKSSRAVAITQKGALALESNFGLNL